MSSPSNLREFFRGICIVTLEDFGALGALGMCIGPALVKLGKARRADRGNRLQRAEVVH
jgi:hypothetical protein